MDNTKMNKSNSSRKNNNSKSKQKSVKKVANMPKQNIEKKEIITKNQEINSKNNENTFKDKDSNTKKRIKLTKNIVYMIVFILLIVLILTYSTYAYFNVNTTNDANLSGISTTLECLNITYSENNVINMTNSYPVTDDYALENYTPLTVTVTNNCSVDISYALTLSTLNNNDNNYISDDKMRIYIKKQVGNGAKATLMASNYISNLKVINSGVEYNYLINELNSRNDTKNYINKNNYSLEKTRISGNTTTSLDIYLWIDYYEGDTTQTGLNNNSTMNKNFNGAINLIVNGEDHEGFYLAYQNFTGAECINTKVSLFSNKNWQRDFELGFTVNSFGTGVDNTQKTIFYSKLETDPWPGMYFRMNKTQVVANYKYLSGSRNINNYYEKNFLINNPVKIIRINNILFYKFDNNNFIRLYSMKDFSRQFENPVTFGCALDNNGNELDGRNFIGELSEMYINYYDEIKKNEYINDLNNTIEDEVNALIGEEMETVYEFNGTKVFDGKSANVINTGVELFSTENYQKDFVISFEVEDSNVSNNKNIVVDYKYNSANNKFPGFYFRNSANNYIIQFSDGKEYTSTKNIEKNNKKIKIIRKDMKIHWQYEIEQISQYGDVTYEAFTTDDCFDIPLSFGGGINEDGSIISDKLFVGKISNIKVQLEKTN